LCAVRLKFGGHLGQFGDGVHVAGGAVFQGGDDEAGLALAVGVVDVDFAEAEAEVLLGVVFQGGETADGGRGVEEDGHDVAVVTCGKRIGGEHGGNLRCGADEDADGTAHAAGESGFEDGLDCGFGLAGLEDDVAAGDPGADGFEAEVFTEGLEVGHGKAAGSHEVEGAEKGDVGGHGWTSLTEDL